MTQQHTKGPWYFEEAREQFSIYGGKLYKGHKRPRPVARTDTAFATDKENARLISAAPELLEALERCYEVFKMDDVDTALSLQCGMAITKARGQE